MLSHKFTIIEFFYLIVLIIMLNIIEAYAEIGGSNVDEGKIYEYKWANIQKVLSRIGYQDFFDHEMSRYGAFDTISRNADGSSINIINRTNNRALVMDCNGTVKHFKLLNSNSWFDHNNNILMWPDASGQNKNKCLKGDGPASFDAIDPSGQYFISWFDNKYYAITSINHPDTPLAKVDVISNQFLYIFTKRNQIYVFGHTERSVSTPLKAFIYERKGSKVELIEKIEIPRAQKHGSPYVVEDLSPWSDEILLRDMRPFPSLSKFYIYNLTSKELKYYGLATKDRGLFLKCDILEKVQEKYREP